MAKKIRYDKPLPSKEQDRLLQKAETTVRRYKDHWDKLYTGDFINYRRLAAGKLPDGIEEKLKKKKYTGKAKLVPRIVADHVEDKVGSVMNATLNREFPFRFIGQSEGDSENAENARKLVMHNWQFTKFKMQARKTIRDAGIVGAGWLERTHFIDRRLKRAYGGIKGYESADFDTVYIGAKFNYVRTEMVYPEPQPPGLDFGRITGIVKMMSVPISAIRKEGMEGGLYYKYAKNIKNIKAEDYKTDTETQYSISDDHSVVGDSETELDYKALVVDWWTSLLDLFGNELPVWHVTTIANWGMNPQLLRCGIDPMGNGKHPFYMCRLFDPSEPRLMGTGLPEKLYQHFLEAYYKRNQRINLINSASKRAGLLLGPRSAFPPDFIEANADLIIYSNNGRDITHLPTDLSAYQYMLREEEKVEKDAERTAATNPISMGLSPERRETATTTATLDQNAKQRTLDPVGLVEQTLICPAAEDTHEHNLILVPEPYIGRVLGTDRQPQFFKFSRADILGRFDAICQGSSEVTPKAMKLANYNAMVQTYANLPVQIDWGKFAVAHFKLAEIGDAEGVVITSEIEQENIARENGAMSNGIPWLPLPHEDHQTHIGGHQQYIQLMLSQGADPQDPGILTIQSHNKMHYQMMAMKQGALAQGAQQGSFADMGELLNRVGTDNMARVSM